MSSMLISQSSLSGSHGEHPKPQCRPPHESYESPSVVPASTLQVAAMFPGGAWAPSHGPPHEQAYHCANSGAGAGLCEVWSPHSSPERHAGPCPCVSSSSMPFWAPLGVLPPSSSPVQPASHEENRRLMRHVQVANLFVCVIVLPRAVFAFSLRCGVPTLIGTISKCTAGGISGQWSPSQILLNVGQPSNQAARAPSRLMEFGACAAPICCGAPNAPI